MRNGNARPPALCAGEAPDEKLKINELGPYAIHACDLSEQAWSQLLPMANTVNIALHPHNLYIYKEHYLTSG